MMLICCLAPVLFFFVAPALGLNKDNSFWILIPVMLLVCFMMMGKGGGCCGGHSDKETGTDKKEENQKKYGCH